MGVWEIWAFIHCYAWQHHHWFVLNCLFCCLTMALQWCHNEHDGVSNHWRLDCLLNCLFRHRSKKTSNLHITGFVRGIHWWIPHTKGPVTRKMFPFDDFIMEVETIIPWSITVKNLRYLNTLRPRQDGCHFADKVANAFSWMKMHQFWLRFHWSLIPRVQLTIYQHWFR